MLGHMQQRKGARDSLGPVAACRWLVVRDRFSVVVGYQELKPNADLRAAMSTERARRLTDGWSVGEIPRNCSFFFCERGEDRVCVAIECFEPGSRAHPGWRSG